MFMRKNQIRLIVVLLLAISGFFAGLVLFQNWKVDKAIDPNQFAGTILKYPRELSAFQLKGIDGQPFTRESLKGQWTMVFFGFTSCGSICPLTMAKLAKTVRLLEKQGIQPLPKVVMISVDPERDSLTKLSDYVKAWHPQFYGARGKATAVRKIAREFGADYEKTIPAGQLASQYDIQHSGTIMLVNPQGLLAGFFTVPHKPALLAKDYITLKAISH